MRLTIFLYGSDHAEHTKNSLLTEDEAKLRKVYADRNKLCTGGHRPNSLGSRWSVSEMKCWQFLKILKLDSFNSKLFEWIYGANSVIATYRFYGSILKKNIVVRLFSRPIFEESIDFLVDTYY